jgi:hypothetical protein
LLEENMAAKVASLECPAPIITHHHHVLYQVITTHSLLSLPRTSALSSQKSKFRGWSLAYISVTNGNHWAITRLPTSSAKHTWASQHVAHLRQQCHNSKSAIFQDRIFKGVFFFKCYNFLYVQRRHNCSPAASFANCVMTLYLLKVHLQTFLSIPVTQKCQILSCDTLVANEWHVSAEHDSCSVATSSQSTHHHYYTLNV